MKLQALAESYLDSVIRLRSKSPLTVKKERCALKGWVAAYGDREAGSIAREDLNDYAMNRAETICNRTVNLDVLALHNVLKFGLETGEITVEPLVTEKWTALKHKTPRRKLIPDDALDRLCAEATRRQRRPHRNGRMLADYLRLLAYSGCRKTAGLQAKWEDVDFKAGTIIFHTKFDKDVIVRMNHALRLHLEDMCKRRNHENPWLFPSPDRSLTGHWASSEKVFGTVSRVVKLPDVTFHDLRHAFASRAVMAGIDFMTVAAMLGHSDGGILVSKVYGHLSDEHLRSAAAKMTF